MKCRRRARERRMALLTSTDLLESEIPLIGGRAARTLLGGDGFDD